MVHFSACFFHNRCACFFSFEQLLSTLSLTRHERALRFTCRRATCNDKSFNFISTRNRRGKFQFHLLELSCTKRWSSTRWCLVKWMNEWMNAIWLVFTTDISSVLRFVAAATCTITIIHGMNLREANLRKFRRRWRNVQTHQLKSCTHAFFSTLHVHEAYESFSIWPNFPAHLVEILLRDLVAIGSARSIIFRVNWLIYYINDLVESLPCVEHFSIQNKIET